MAITLTGTGGIWVRLGKIFQAIRSANRYSGDGAITSASPDLDALGTSFTEVIAQYASNEQDLMNNLPTQRDGARTALSGWKSALAKLASDTVIEQVHRDVTLVNKTLSAALTELIYQMAGVGGLYNPDNDIDASTVSITTAAVSTIKGANTGNAVLVGSVKRPDSRDNELVLAETLDVICTSDNQSNSAGRAESWSVKGEPSITSLDYRWPDGSGTSKTLTTVNSDSNNSSGNLLYNSTFNAFTTTNTPDYWGSPLVGAYGTDIFEEATTVYRTSRKALKFTGTGGNPLSSIAQTFGVTTPAVGTSGTSATLKPNTVYLFNCFIRKSAGLVAGVIEFSLVDGSNTQMTNAAGTDIKSTIAFGTLTTSFASFSGAFVTPNVLPTTGQKFRVRASTALTSGESVYIADLAFTEATNVYNTGTGPYMAMFAGSTNPIIGDAYTATVANNYAGDFQLMCDQVFGINALGLQIPSDTGGTETIADSLIG